MAFNRTASSTGETEALYYIKKKLLENNIKTQIEHFDWMGPLKLLMRLVYLFILIYCILLRLFLLIIIYFIMKNMFETTRRITFIQREESKNIYVNIPAKEIMPNRTLVIISTHYDSISANIPYKLQVIIFFLYRIIVAFYIVIFIGFSMIFFLDFYSIFPFPSNIIYIIIFSSISALFVSIPILYMVFVEQPSSGSIDNASGVAISIELAKIFKSNPLEKIDLLFIWTGAEEWGLKGSKNFCKQHFKHLIEKYDFDRSFNINIDMVGSYIGLLDKTGFIIKRKINKNLNDILEETANHLNIPIVKYNRIIKPKSDYRAFGRYAKRLKKKNFQVSCFHSSKDSKYIHSLKDTPDKCSTDNLNGCLNICYQSLRSIDSRIENT
ncbi:MAG: M28 family metallopeptidase [Candidatus Odinarchaeota archaeon]